MNPQKLLVPDYRAVRTYAVGGGAASELGDATPAGHAGVLTLPPRGRGSSAPAFAVDRAEPGTGVPHRTPLPPMSRPPAPGHLPRDPVGGSPAQRRAVAVDPGGTGFPVTRGGDGQPHVTEGDEPDTVAVPGPLAEGGRLHRRGGDTDTSGSEG
ncbi:hypothetical protein [Nocardiopsis tropica]|uniref:Uncharacterized protein n=1 Tax=Nocardiopsis tropica TaxID=109330 RepID=A0ABU7KNZ2_9ACTN|nr:hypothetical protein [Nocardiopsis umidischolae]MEE2051005.1 hypothetical protein [Nocardiopsis umidischolae]